MALGLLEEDRDLVAVGGLFYGEDGGRLVGQFQRNEYARYQRLVARKLDRVFVLTGTASVIRAYALRAVAEARGPLLPGPVGQVYDTLALTEDNELTLALKTLGARMTSPPQCRVTTEIMTSWRHLWRQRLRWHRGALENIGAYGLTRATAMYWGQQLAPGLRGRRAPVLPAVDDGEPARRRQHPLVAVLDRRSGRSSSSNGSSRRGAPVGAAAPSPRAILPELGYVVFLQACFVTSMIQILLGRKAGWNYVPRPASHAILAPWLLAWLLTAWGIVLPASVLQTDWYTTLALWVGFNTLVFACLSLLQLLPPLRRRGGHGPGLAEN